jgi:DNA-binding NarL/FixJ family response regulator
VTLRCLIVDDSPAFLTSAALLLESQGLDVVGRATCGVDARRLVSTLEPDVALVDIELGAEDGIAVTHELVAHTPTTRVVLVSAHEREELRDLIVDSPAVGFLPKTALGAAAIRGLLGVRSG